MGPGQVIEVLVANRLTSPAPLVHVRDRARTWAAGEAFGIDVARLHRDMTSISLHGDYEQTEPGFARPRSGHPKGRRPDLKQIQARIAVTADGSVPVFHRAYHGAAGEVGQVIGAMQALPKPAGPQQMPMIVDSKLISYANLAAMAAGSVSFVAPASKVYVSAETMAGLEAADAIKVDYLAARDAGKSAERRGVWHVRSA
ncbi:transposase [Streptosporangium album]|uniref:Transposase n=1 Tax=Streptosporangium album TaxID=47479 RepID=A0A7W7RWS8_9ACTN|nr:hypothetical protein [Streptosporangium album]MBB4939023.1 transposase [Streptosporangium album]